jgi:hypothetical protein
LAISKAWPIVIWSFRNTSATGGMRSASLIRPYYVRFTVMWCLTKVVNLPAATLLSADNIIGGCFACSSGTRQFGMVAEV